LVVEMTNSSSVPHLASEFDAFLFAPVGEDRNGMPLTVLSTLARSELDPWQEAARLTEASGKVATERLAWLITSLPGRPSTLLDSGTVAARLVALLPRRAISHGELGKTPPGVRTMNGAKVAVFVIFMVLTLAVQWAVFSNPAPTKAASSVPAAASTVSPHIPPSSAGR
jgi:hypothetical protein